MPKHYKTKASKIVAERNVKGNTIRATAKTNRNNPKASTNRTFTRATTNRTNPKATTNRTFTRAKTNR